MDALKLLTADHNRVRGLFNRFKSAAGENDAQAQSDGRQRPRRTRPTARSPEGTEQ
jgi:hypothetical protein